VIGLLRFEAGTSQVSIQETGSDFIPTILHGWHPDVTSLRSYGPPMTARRPLPLKIGGTGCACP